MHEVRVAVVGIGNCASSLVQGVAHYQNGGANEQIGLLHWDLGGYRPKDIRFVAGWDVDRRKVGMDIAEAIFAKPNCTAVFCDHVPEIGVAVRMGRVLDGVGEHMADYPDDRTFLVADGPPVSTPDLVRRVGRALAAHELHGDVDAHAAAGVYHADEAMERWFKLIEGLKAGGLAGDGDDGDGEVEGDGVDAEADADVGAGAGAEVGDDALSMEDGGGDVHLGHLRVGR